MGAAVGKSLQNPPTGRSGSAVGGLPRCPSPGRRTLARGGGDPGKNEGVSSDAILVGIQRMWDGTDTIVESIVDERRGIEFEKSVRREGRRADFFSRVLNGTFSRDELAAIGRASCRERVCQYV